MAENEFEKNVQREMDEFKLHPSVDVWPKIEERIREKNRKRRILFFVLFSVIALMLVGYGIYNFSGTNREAALQRELSNDDRHNDKNKIDKSQNKEHNKETIAIKPNIPTDIKQPDKTLTSTKQKRPTQLDNGKKQVTFITKRDPGSQKEDLAQNMSLKEQKNDVAGDTTDRGNSDISSLAQRPIIMNSNQSEIAKGDKNLPINDTASKLEESKDTRSVQLVNRKKKDNHRGKIIWGINFSAGSSVITEDAFSFKSSYATADMQFSAPGSSTGGGPITGGGGGGPVTYYRYAQSQNEPAFAFKTGINARKNISKRSSLSAGLGYSYLADKIKVGKTQILGQSQSAFSLSYYSGSPQTTYTDHFHFIELPLSYLWRVTNNTDHFLSLNAGISPSYLLATNALLYDTAAGGIYYHNKDLVTKAHFNFISGISYQFKNKKSLEFSIGPQFSFDVTEVFKSDLDKRKYFLYTGIDARVFFENKKK